MQSAPVLQRSDLVRRFIFENRPVRGHWSRLEGAWRELRAHADYPTEVMELLGEAVVASLLLAATLKFRGTLTFQLQGNGALNLLVAQCTHDFRVRAVARCEAAVFGGLVAASRGDTRFRQLAGSDGRITVTVEAEERNMRYQGIVPLSGSSLAESLEAYFASSEQLPTRVLLAADAGKAAGIVLQKLPGAGTAGEAADVWQGAQRDFGRVSAQALLGNPLEALLSQSFSGHDLRVFRGKPVRFECRCSPGRVAGLLQALGPEEVRAVLQEQGSVTVTCEFCHRPYRFGATDVEALFAPTASPDGSQLIH